ncbi:MAG TPA: D-alanyl-D-alanine carboxypeptidase family protein [Pedococcus sp.]|nr:D-alanyl-D-alanine carboxypeptidase family protein [Pedococcus sp.]
MGVATTLATRRPARLGLVAALGLGVVLGGAAAADAAIGHVRTQSSPLTVRSGPGTSYAAVGAVARGARITIVCHTKGSRVKGPYGSTDVWDKLGDGRWVADAYTSSSDPSPECSPSALDTVAVAYRGSRPCSTDERPYTNGRVPRSALCTLRDARSESLRPKAAAAFDALSAAYRQHSGHALCVTDSYRSYDEQVAVKATRGRWAATPGRSEHGLGLAVDLCGGVDRFGTDAHRWMVVNAPHYGWVHPAWADAGGSLPEPWHWEYAG